MVEPSCAFLLEGLCYHYRKTLISGGCHLPSTSSLEELGSGGLSSLIGKMQHLGAQPVSNRVEQGSRFGIHINKKAEFLSRTRR